MDHLSINHAVCLHLPMFLSLSLFLLLYVSVCLSLCLWLFLYVSVCVCVPVWCTCVSHAHTDIHPRIDTQTILFLFLFCDISPKTVNQNCHSLSKAEAGESTPLKPIMHTELIHPIFHTIYKFLPLFPQNV